MSVGVFDSDFLMELTRSDGFIPPPTKNHTQPRKTCARAPSGRFKNRFSEGVIKIDARTKQVNVNEARRETMTREIYRHPEFDGCVQLARVRDHFLCETFLRPGVWSEYLFLFDS